MTRATPICCYCGDTVYVSCSSQTCDCAEFCSQKCHREWDAWWAAAKDADPTLREGANE